MKYYFIAVLIPAFCYAYEGEGEFSLRIDEMVEAKVISKEEAAKTKMRLSRAPASVDSSDLIRQFKSKDSSKSQIKQIEDDLNTLLPED